MLLLLQVELKREKVFQLIYPSPCRVGRNEVSLSTSTTTILLLRTTTSLADGLFIFQGTGADLQSSFDALLSLLGPRRWVVVLAARMVHSAARLRS